MGNLFFTSKPHIILVLGLILSISLFVSQASGQVEFLPLLSQPNQGSTEKIALPEKPSGESRDIVHFADGAIQFRPPLNWQVAETAVGQEIRLIIHPQDTSTKNNKPEDYLWLTYNVRPLSGKEISRELQEMMISRLKLSTDNLAISKNTTELHFGPWKARKQEFILPDSDKGQHADSKIGYHILVRTSWGILEIHAKASSSDRLAEYDSILQSLVVQAPEIISPPVQKESILAAKSILGKWKTTRGRFILQPNGQIRILFDREGIYPIDKQGSSRLERRLAYLSGRYTARDDLLIVTWEDGSRMNFRWRENRGQLFLTDHTGRVSRLRRLLE